MARIKIYYIIFLSLQKIYINDTVFEFENIIQRKRIKIVLSRRSEGPHRPYDAESSVAAHGAGPHASSQSVGSPLGHTHVPQQSQYAGGSAHNKSTSKA
jgi:hypothetical protein